MSQDYLDDEELAMLGALFQEQQPGVRQFLSIGMDESLFALLEHAGALELHLELDGARLTFPVTLSPSRPADGAELNPPQITILAANTVQRDWRLPHPEGLKLLEQDGQTVAADIRDLSTSGMRLMSAQPLFEQVRHKTARLELDGEQQLPLELKLVRAQKRMGVWVTTVRFELPMADRLALSEFVFQGFLNSRKQKRP